MTTEKQCPKCSQKSTRIMRHIKTAHPDLYKKECKAAVELFKSGLTMREIGASDLTLWSFGAALGRVIRENTDASTNRSQKISTTLKNGYKNGTYKLIGRGRKGKKKKIDSPIDIHPLKLLSYGGQEVNKQLILSMSDQEVKDLEDALVEYLSKCDLTKFNYRPQEILDEWKKLQSANVKIINGELPNVRSDGHKIYRTFFPSLLEISSGGKPSVLCALTNEETLRQVLKNRLSKRILGHYSGNITRNMCIQGAKASGKSFVGSQFKPLVAKAIYDRYVKDGDNVLDYSAGFGSRLLGLMATGKNVKYFAYEPYSKTYESLIKMSKFFNFNVDIKNCGSEECVFGEKMDFAFSSPPYFNHEIYTDEKTQCYNKYPEYQAWLESYWRQTIKNIKLMLKPGAVLGVNVGNDANKKMSALKKDMLNIVEEEGFVLHEIIKMKTLKAHFNKKKTGSLSKYEDINFYRRK